MNDKDRKYLRNINKMRPGLEVFKRMAGILENQHSEIDKLLTVVDSTLLENYRTT